MTAPKRIQRKRTKGWRMPEGAVYVGRPTKWGNPFVVGQTWTAPNGAQIVIADPAAAVGMFASHAHTWSPQKVQEVRAELAGKDLVCWCYPIHACHADVLLEIANGGAS